MAASKIELESQRRRARRREPDAFPCRLIIGQERRGGCRLPLSGWDSGVRTAEETGFFSDFGCFGFFASRLDRRCPFAMTASFVLQPLEWVESALWDQIDRGRCVWSDGNPSRAAKSPTAGNEAIAVVIVTLLDQSSNQVECPMDHGGIRESDYPRRGTRAPMPVRHAISLNVFRREATTAGSARRDRGTPEKRQIFVRRSGREAAS